MKVKDLIKELQSFSQEAEVLLSQDEELNAMFKDIQVATLSDRKNTIVMWGNSGSEVGEE